MDDGVDKLPNDAVARFFQRRAEFLLVGSFLLAFVLALAAWWLFS